MLTFRTKTQEFFPDLERDSSRTKIKAREVRIQNSGLPYFPTIKINGATGALRPPHAVTGLLKSQAVRDACMVYARAHMPAMHPLRLAGWCALPAHERELATPVGFEA